MVNQAFPEDELLKKAQSEVNEDPKRRQADIEFIRDWINKQPHLNARTGILLN